ncbi:MAG: hypothetical protein WBJ32_03980 [Bacillota bacterium]|nr:hypothetical protein [Bacillota bacterium]
MDTGRFRGGKESESQICETIGQMRKSDWCKQSGTGAVRHRSY